MGKSGLTTISAYLDTCIISGIAREDIGEEHLDALAEILEHHKAGEITLLTSEIANSEIAGVPEKYRRKHLLIYNLTANIPTATEYQTVTHLTLLGVGGGRRLDPLFIALRKVLPDQTDASHLFQAAKNQVDVFVTTDQRTILSRRDRLKDICDVRPMNPAQLIERFRNNGP